MREVKPARAMPLSGGLGTLGTGGSIAAIQMFGNGAKVTASLRVAVLHSAERLVEG
jgi:hypothetical protein